VLIPTARSTYSMFMQVPSGCYCIVQRFGKDIGEMAPGLKVLPSFYRIAYIVSKQSCTYDAPVLNCPTSDDVRVSVDVVLVFAVNDPSKFIYRLGAKNFDDFLSGTVDEAIRMLVRKEDHKTVYALRGERADHMLKLLNDKFLESGVRFTQVKISSVRLPDALDNCVETTTKLEKAMERLKRQNSYEKLQIKLENEMAIEQIGRTKEQTLVAESGVKRRAELEFEQRSVKAEEDGRVSLIESEGQAEAQLVTVNAELKRIEYKKEKFIDSKGHCILEIAEAATAAAEVRIQADMEEEQAVIQAIAAEDGMKQEAVIIKTEAKIEGQAYTLLAKRRKHDLDLREKAILQDLATKGNFNLIGTSGDKMIEAMMKGQFDKSRV